MRYKKVLQNELENQLIYYVTAHEELNKDFSVHVTFMDNKITYSVVRFVDCEYQSGTGDTLQEAIDDHSEKYPSGTALANLLRAQADMLVAQAREIESKS